MNLDDLDPAELEAMADEAITAFNQGVDKDTRELVIGNFLHTGNLDAHVIGVDQVTLDATVKAFENKMTTEALQPFGLDLDTYLDHCDEAAYRLSGTWSCGATGLRSRTASRIRAAPNAG